MSELGMMRIQLFSSHPGNKPGMRITEDSSLRKDTGGERRFFNPKVNQA